MKKCEFTDLLTEIRERCEYRLYHASKLTITPRCVRLCILANSERSLERQTRVLL